REVHHRLCDGPVHEADTHPGSEQHRQPTDVRIFGLRVGAAEPHAAEPREHDDRGEDEESLNEQYEQPTEILGDPALYTRIDRAHVVECDDREYDEESDKNDRREKYRRMHDETK